MIVCENCPYRGKCENRDRCIQGKNPPPAPQPAPIPQNVNTSKGNALTGIMPKKPAAKKAPAKKATMQ